MLKLYREDGHFTVPVNNKNDVRSLLVLRAMNIKNSVVVDLLRKFAVAFDL
jgi:hypothetical protein